MNNRVSRVFEGRAGSRAESVGYLYNNWTGWFYDKGAVWGRIGDVEDALVLASAAAHRLDLAIE